MRVPERLAERTLLVLLGALGFAWGLTAIADEGEVRRLAELRSSVLEGETFDEVGVGAISEQLEKSRDLSACATRPLELIVPIRLRLVELALSEEDEPRVVGLGDELERDARKLLSCSPYQSFAWLVLFWHRTVEANPTADDFELLRLSARTGPGEGWISRRRNQVSLAAYDLLPEDLKQAAIDEFLRLAQTGYVIEASTAFVDLAPQVARDRVIERLGELDEEQRSEFAERVSRLSEGKIELPSLEQPEQPE